MREYRSLLNFRGWETDSVMLERVCRVVSQLTELHLEEHNPEERKKFNFLILGVIRRVKAAYFDSEKLPNDRITELEEALNRIAIT
jgi:hypothetical protein